MLVEITHVFLSHDQDRKFPPHKAEAIHEEPPLSLCSPHPALPARFISCRADIGRVHNAAGVIDAITNHSRLQAALAAIAALGSLSAMPINQNITICPKAMLEEAASRAIDQLLPSLVFTNKVRIMPKLHLMIRP